MPLLESAPLDDGTTARQLALALLGAATYGAAAGLGHGPAAILRGAWMAPLYFVGGALLATPPLYLASLQTGERRSAEMLVREVGAVLGAVGMVLLGLSAPAAYFSATLRTSGATTLLVLSGLAVGAIAVASLARRVFSEVSAAASLWTVFALALGLRLTVTLSAQLPGVSP
jgi:hypothetical protein